MMEPERIWLDVLRQMIYDIPQEPKYSDLLVWYDPERKGLEVAHSNGDVYGFIHFDEAYMTVYIAPRYVGPKL